MVNYLVLKSNFRYSDKQRNKAVIFAPGFVLSQLQVYFYNFAQISHCPWMKKIGKKHAQDSSFKNWKLVNSP